MMELVVTGPEPMQRWRRPIPLGEPIRLGRAPRSGWAVPWDALISREHAELHIDGKILHIKRLDSARNPIYLNDVDTVQFSVESGEIFRIGRTSFQFFAANVEDDDSPTPAEERSYNHEELKRVSFQDADLRLEVLSKLPKAISQTTQDEELANSVVRLLLEGIPNAEAAAVVHFEELSETARPKMMRWDARGEEVGRFTPSRRLMLKALQLGVGLLHIWRDKDESNPAFTVSGSLDWAFCMPFKDEGCKGWCVYVSGQQQQRMGTTVQEEHLKGDLRFAELLTEFIGSIRSVRVLSKQQAGLSRFFSPAVMEALRDADMAKRIEPQVADITVLFCDIRGFSKKSEQSQENLRELLDRVSNALGVMSCGISKYDGVTGDFLGDAALGFWGWPTVQDDDRLSACRAALHIHREFLSAMRDSTHILFGFQVGIGLSYGRAIAGQIGTVEQTKVGIFGPTVNVGSRLEGMTKQFGTPILVDELVAEYARQHLPPNEGRIRKIGRFRPAGMSHEITISQLLLPSSHEDTLSDADIVLYEQAWEAFAAGRWQEALDQLEEVPVTDRVREYLRIYITANNGEPPPNWSGTISMQLK
ncbi:MAG: adenylate/guanylate cyclase domain-containing protein [Planctomycetia bacterium]|nr:adenylate/guanylate cyclase domain-containing protein [Planctomycetia bacterium]